MATVREFRVGDGESLVQTWCRSAPYDPITPRRFRDLVLLDANFDSQGLRVAVERDRVVGAAYAVRRTVAMVGDDLERGRGWLPFFFVTPEARRQGIGSALLDSALAWLRDHGTTTVEFSGYTPNYILPGLDTKAYPHARSLLEHRGFRTSYEAVAMDRSLVDYTLPDPIREHINALTSEGYRIGTPTDDDLPELITLARDHFNPEWARAIRECLTAGTTTDRIICAHDPHGTLIGWAQHETYAEMTERFGPFGVLETRRGTGLGKVLLHLTLERMRAVGAHSAWFLWTGEQSPAGQLYLKTGFTISRRFAVMRAQISG